MSRLTIPKLINSEHGKFLVRNYESKHLEALFNIFQKSMADGTGVGEGEFSTVNQLQVYLNKSFSKLFLQDYKTDRIFGCVLSYPSPLSRSESPLCGAGYYILDAEYHGKNLQRHLMDIRYSASVDAGYPLLVGRYAATARTRIPALQHGRQFIGIIPQSLRNAKLGWVYDTIGFLDLRPTLTKEELEKFHSRLNQDQTLPKHEKNATLQQADELVEIQEIQTKLKERIVVKGANINEVELVENVIRNCAVNGEGFNMDEFSSTDGHYLHKFIFNPKVLVAMATDDSVLGAAVYGLSTLSRVPGSLLTAYLITKESERQRGIATVLLNVVTEQSRKQECNMMLIDVFINNHIAIKWLSKQGFTVTGSIPYCGYINQEGFLDSLLMCKKLDIIDKS